MNDSQLKEHLLATCPVLPGQEARAWRALQDRLSPAPAALGGKLWLFSKIIGYSAFIIAAVVGIFSLGLGMRPVRHGLAFADSQVPGIYATSFYSHSAQAQVVWLNGMDPVTDKLTYLDPTSVIKTGSMPSTSPADQNADRL